ncbi:MAG: hypothetical protein MHM6MM_007248 [Cercozoa sp. M6MM]
MIARSFKVIQRVRQSRMAGHSHWQNIQHKKKANDAKKSAAREQLMRPLVSAIARLPRQGGADPETNVPLSLAIKEAVRGGVPKKNVERALQRAADAIQNSRDYNFELRAPNSVLLRLEFFTPNQPRTFSDIMAAIKKLDGVEETKAAFAFDHVGVFVFSSEDVELETVEEVAIDSGAEDVFEEDGDIVVQCAADDFYPLQQALVDANLAWRSAETTWLPQEAHQTSLETQEQRDDFERIIERLDQIEYLENIHHNVAPY